MGSTANRAILLSAGFAGTLNWTASCSPEPVEPVKPALKKKVSPCEKANLVKENRSKTSDLLARYKASDSYSVFFNRPLDGPTRQKFETLHNFYKWELEKPKD